MFIYRYLLSIKWINLYIYHLSIIYEMCKFIHKGFNVVSGVLVLRKQDFILHIMH